MSGRHVRTRSVPGATGAPGAVVVVERLVVRYGRGRTAVTALDGVDLAVAAGETVALAGPSGSGKSSLVHVVTGFERPTSGTVRVDGADPAAPLGWDVVAVVPQRLGLVPELTVAETVLLPRALAATTSSGPDLDALLDALGLTGLGDRRVGETSLGEQQRVALARARVLGPRLLVLDEPTGHQDDEHVELVLAATLDAAARGSAVLVSTHDDRVLDVVDRVVRLDEGRVVPTG